MLSENSYYISVEKTSPELREKLLKDINEKFGIKDNSILTAGRFGEWSYLWSDQALLSGKVAANNILTR